jgi:hypothetical protein
MTPFFLFLGYFSGSFVLSHIQPQAAFPFTYASKQMRL